MAVKILAACALLLVSQPVWPCTVFLAFDGKLAVAGDNEDYYDRPDTQVWTVPPGSGTYGVIYFGFGRGEYPGGGASMTARARQILAGSLPISEVRVEDTYGLPQQGMNEKGLFFGGASTEAVPSDPAQKGKPEFDGVLIDYVLRHAANVREALQIIQSYNIPSTEGQMLFADRSGNSFVWESGGVVLPGTGRYQVITNFLQSRKPSEKRRDRRFKIVDGQLSVSPQLSHDLVRTLLQEAQQDSTQYSIVFDLTNLSMDVYQRRQFTTPVTLHMPEELSKGPRASSISALFEWIQ